MSDLSIEDLVLLHLRAVDTGTASCTTSGLGDALGIGTILSDRIELMSALSALGNDGLIEKQAADQHQSGRITYTLTDAGSKRAADCYEAHRDDPVVIVDADTERTVSLVEARDELDVPSIASVLGRARDGVIRLGAVPDDAFVGRDEELATLDTHLTALDERDGSVVRLTGPRGVGKTELLSRLAGCARERGHTVVEITCRSDASEPYQPVRDALAEHGLADVFDSVGGQLDAAGSLEGHRAGLFLAVRDALAELAAEAPVVVTVDDLHEATSATVDLLSVLAENRPEGLLLVVASRPERVEQCDAETTEPAASTLETVGGPDPADIELAPLDRELTHELVVRLLGDSSVPETLSDAIYDRTGGTPLFVIEYVTQLQEAGTVDPAAGLFQVPTAEGPIPETVTEAIAARLEPLPDPARSIVEYGAIIGETIPVDVLETASDCPDGRVAEYVDLLIGAQLWTDDPVQFASEMIRDVVLERLSGERQERLHRAVARAYEQTTGEDGHVAAARHHLQAGDRERALDTYHAAGDRAIDVYAHEAALDCYQQALELARSLDRPDRLADLLESIGRVHYVTGEYEAARRYYQFLLDRTDDPARVEQAYRDLAEVAIESGEFEQADEYARQGIEAVDEPTRISCRLRGHLGWTKQLRGETDAAEAEFERQRELAEQLDDDDRRAGVYNNLAVLAFNRGNVEKAIDLSKQSVEANERAGSVRDTAATYNNLGKFYFHAGDHEPARTAFEEAADRAREVGDSAQVAKFEGNIGVCLKRQGEWDEARERCESALAAAETIGLRQDIAAIKNTLGTIASHRGRFAAAREWLEAALETGEETGHAMVTARASVCLARVALYEDEFEAARAHARTALEHASEPATEASAQVRLGDVAFLEGNLETARGRYEHGRETARDCASKRWLAEAQLRLAVVDCETDVEAATELAEAALATAIDLETPSTIAKARLALARCHRAAGRFEAASAQLDDALEIAGQLEAVPLCCLIHAERGRLVTARAESEDEAEAHLSDALALAEQAGAPFLERHCREALAPEIEPA